MRLLIVDDEPPVRDNLASNIDWEALGFVEVLQAGSGKEALTLLERNPIDIMITDIRMPGISGLELLECVRKRWKRVKTVVLTGYADFEYAKVALKEQATDYLLKPVRNEDVQAAVSHAARRLREEWSDISSYQKAVQTLNEHLPRLRQDFLGDLLRGKRISADTLAEKLETLRVPLRLGDPVLLLIVRMEEEFADYDYGSLSLLEYATANIAEEVFQDEFAIWHSKDENGFLLFALQPLEAGAIKVRDVERLAEQLQAYVKSYLKGKVSVLISRPGTFGPDLGTLYDSAIAAFRRRVGHTQELLFTDTEMDSDPAARPNDKVPTLRTLYEVPALASLAKAGDWEAVQRRLQAVFVELEEGSFRSQEFLMEAYLQIASVFVQAAHAAGKSLEDVIGDDAKRLWDGGAFLSAGQLKEWALRVVHRLREDLTKEIQDERAELIERLKKYILTRLDGDVSLETLADHVFHHPVYLSKIFKLETGISLSDYISRQRMERAAFLLRTTDKKIYEIGQSVGYQYPPYFIKVFKKCYGVTPQEYRDGQE